MTFQLELGCLVLSIFSSYSVLWLLCTAQLTTVSQRAVAGNSMQNLTLSAWEKEPVPQDRTFSCSLSCTQPQTLIKGRDLDYGNRILLHLKCILQNCTWLFPLPQQSSIRWDAIAFISTASHNKQTLSERLNSPRRMCVPPAGTSFVE